MCKGAVPACARICADGMPALAQNAELAASHITAKLRPPLLLVHALRQLHHSLLVPLVLLQRRRQVLRITKTAQVSMVVYVASDACMASKTCTKYVPLGMQY